jgi:hypothetical protein
VTRLRIREHPQRFHCLVVVVEGLAHAHQHDVEGGLAHVQRAGKDTHLAHDFTGGQVPYQTHLAGQAERARHRAADLGRNAEGHRRRIRDEDRFDVPAVDEPQQELLRAIGRHFALLERRRRQREVISELSPQLQRQVGHRGGIGDAAAIDPAEDLSRAETFVTACDERGLERRTFELGEVGRAGLAGHDC